MTIRAVAFDLGGVLEYVGPAEQFVARWRERLGVSEAAAGALLWPLTRADPADRAKTGVITQAEYHEHCLTVLGLTGSAGDEFMAEFWDWYCGELDTELAAYAAALRPGYQTAILSNSVAGARAQEQARFGFEQLVDVIVYSDEVGLAKPDPRIYALLCAELGRDPDEVVFVDNRPPNVAAACAAGIHGILHERTPASIAAIEALIRPVE